MFKIILTCSLLFFSINLYSQKVDITSSNDEEATQVIPKVSVLESTPVVVAVESSKKSNGMIGLDVFKNFGAFDSFEKVVQSFPSLVCENKFTNPLDLQCYECDYRQKDGNWKLSFHRKEVGDEGCDLAGIQRVFNVQGEFPLNRKEFKKIVKEIYSVDFEKAGEKEIAGTAEEDIQIYTSKVFSNAQNKFNDTLVAQVQFIHSLANQAKIKNAIDTLDSAFQSLPRKAFDNFVTELFPDDSSSLKKKLGQVVLNDYKDIASGDQVELSEEVIKTQFENSKLLVKSLSYHRSNEDYKKFHSCYEELLMEKLPIRLEQNLAEELRMYEFLSLPEKEKKMEEGVDETAKAVSVENNTEDKSVLVSWNKDFKNTKKDASFCSGLKEIQTIIKDESTKNLLCSEIGDQFLTSEKKYKEFFKGDDDLGFKMYRAFLVSELMQLSESEYFRETSIMEKISKESNNAGEDLKDQAQKIEFSYSKVNDYQEELENLLPYLGESLKLRKDWMLKGVASPEVFRICKNK